MTKEFTLCQVLPIGAGPVVLLLGWTKMPSPPSTPVVKTSFNIASYCYIYLAIYTTGKLKLRRMSVCLSVCLTYVWLADSSLHQNQ